MLIEKEFGLTVWPEFYFSTERLYRIDYAIPVDQNGKELKSKVAFGLKEIADTVQVPEYNMIWIKVTFYSH